MLDMSRNGVMQPRIVKKYIDILKKMGYNSLMLYTEDTYEIEGEPYFGYLRGRYTVEELKDIDKYAKENNIELIPCIQTLAHLNGIFRWAEYEKIRDIDDILLIGDDRTYALIEKMFQSISNSFTLRTIVIGMDEAHNLGRGKYADKYGIKPSFELMQEHLQKVSKIAEKYQFKALMWSDMFLRIVNDGEYYGDNPIPKEIAQQIPKNVTPIYWDYYHIEESEYEKYIDLHDSMKENLWFAGGTWCWAGFVPELQFALKSTRASMRACRHRGIKNIIMTLWGDNGRECSCFTALPILYYAIETYKGEENLERIKQKFKEIVGEDFDAFMLLDYPNQCHGKTYERDNPSKYMFYNDVFNGVCDTNVRGGEDKYYKQGKRIFSKLEKESKNFGYLFRFEKELCAVLEKKFDLGLRTRKAYIASDKVQLATIAKEYGKCAQTLKKFLNVFQELWEQENKMQGFEIHQNRIGGLIQRILCSKNRIERYISGKIEEISELNEEILDPYGLKNKQESGFIHLNWWLDNISVNRF